MGRDCLRDRRVRTDMKGSRGRGLNLKSGDSCISDPKSEISNRTRRRYCGAVFVVVLAALLAPAHAVAQRGGRGQAPAEPIAPQDPKTLKRDPQGHPDFTG